MAVSWERYLGLRYNLKLLRGEEVSNAQKEVIASSNRECRDVPLLSSAY